LEVTITFVSKEASRSDVSFPPEGGFPPAGRIANDWRRWGVLEILLGIVFGHILVVITYGLVSEIGGYEDFSEFPRWLVALSSLPLQGSMAVAAVLAASYRGGGIVKDFLFKMERNDIFVGLSVGLAAQFLLVPALTWPVLWLFDIDVEEVKKVAEELTDHPSSTIGVIALLLFIGIFTPIAEELFFRGLLYGALRKGIKYSGKKCIWISMIISSLIFSAVHLQLILLPALFGVGMVFALLYEKSGRLAPAIWAHIGFNMVTLVNLLF
jgi:uncharacterized protein